MLLDGQLIADHEKSRRRQPRGIVTIVISTGEIEVCFILDVYIPIQKFKHDL